jgi:hypothetical protein
MYVGVVAAILGQALLFGSLVLLEYAGLVWLAFFAFVVLYEEPALQRTFGSSYTDYRAHVRRWWPRITPWRGSRATSVAILLCFWTPQIDRPLVSVLTDVGDEDRRELPADYTGVWNRNGGDPFCITSEREGRSMTVHSLDTQDGRKTWRAREKGSAFVVDGVVYAYLMDQVTNLAIGRIVRFQGAGASRSLSMLDPDVLRHTLEKRGLAMTRTTSQLRVDADVVIEVLRDRGITFDVIATGRPESSESLPRCP